MNAVSIASRIHELEREIGRLQGLSVSLLKLSRRQRYRSAASADPALQSYVEDLARVYVNQSHGLHALKAELFRGVEL